MSNFNNKCEAISEKILRLHILANSDSAEDQELKLKVRDKVLEYSSTILDKTETKTEAEKITNLNLE